MPLRKPYETKLTPEEELRYKFWKAANAQKDSGEDYDLRGAYKAGLKRDESGHLPDTFKKPNHETYSNESAYVSKEHPAKGRWEKGKFVPLNVTESIAPTVRESSPKRIENKPIKSKVKESDKPSEKAKKRAKEREESKTLGQTLAETAALLPEGTGPATSFLKSTASGAAAGATLGEYIGTAMEKKRQAGKQKKAKTMGEKTYDK